MRNLILVAAFAITLGFSASAQIQTPQASPHSVIEQTVGLTTVKIDYSRPSARGRAVYGELVPFGRLWRTGANANTTITFSEDVVIAGKTLKAGKYALYTQPKVDSWDIIFYTDTNNWGLPEKWDETKEAVRASVKPDFLNRSVETLTIGMNALEADYGYLEIAWEKTMAALKIEVPTRATALKSIEEAMSGPTAGSYFAAAQYFYQSNADLTKALTWIDAAINLTPKGEEVPFYMYRQKALIQAKTGDKDGALASAKLSLQGAEKAGNADYIKMNKDSINEWSKK